MGSYVSTTINEEKEMLNAIGVNSIDDLFKNIPEEVKIKGELNLPDGLSEMEVKNLIESIANKNKVFTGSFHFLLMLWRAFNDDKSHWLDIPPRLACGYLTYRLL